MTLKEFLTKMGHLNNNATPEHCPHTYINNSTTDYGDYYLCNSKTCYACWKDNFYIEVTEKNVKEEYLIELYKYTQNMNNYTCDNVDHPSHYNHGQYECINEMIELFGVEAVIGFCKCNNYKYKSRAPFKHEDNKEDLEKADWYMSKLIELQEGKINGRM